MSRRIVVAMILSVLSVITVGSIVKATEITIQWPIDNPVFTRTIVWDSNANTWAHTGVDTHGLDGQGQRLDNVPVKAMLGGVVTKVYYDSYCATVLTNCGVLLSGGWMIKIDHGDGWESRYAHLKKGSILVDADPATGLKTQVSAGEQIATSGNSGFYKDPETSLPYHLHFELRHKGAIVNPCDYLIGNVGGCGIPGERKLERSAFTVERTNPTLSEEVLFSTEIKNTGEVPVYVNTVFLRLTRGAREVNSYGVQKVKVT